MTEGAIVIAGIGLGIKEEDGDDMDGELDEGEEREGEVILGARDLEFILELIVALAVLEAVELVLAVLVMMLALE
jgi:hypothetical protein